MKMIKMIHEIPYLRHQYDDYYVGSTRIRLSMRAKN